MATNRPSSNTNGAGQPVKQALTKELFSDFVPSRVFRDAVKGDAEPVSGGPPQITSIAFEDSGKTCITAGEDDIFSYWDVLKGRRTAIFGSHKYGVDHITPTHEQGIILHSSTKGNDDVRLHSAPTNCYLKYFKGHTDKVSSISMNPVSKTFLTGSHDGTVLLWDLRTDTAKGRLNQMEGPTLTAWEPTGAVWAVAMPDKHYICLYAADCFDATPFVHATIDDPELDRFSSPRRNPYITSITFSNDGQYLLVGTSGQVHYVLETFDLKVLVRLEGHTGLEKDLDVKARKGLSGAEVCFTPDSRYVMAGSLDGQICVWDISPPEGMTVLPTPGENGGPSRPPTLSASFVLNAEKLGGTARVIAFSPKYMVFASGGIDVSLWLPQKRGEGDGDDMDIADE